MNYFSHAYRFLDDPYFVAGVSLPDWLSVIDRRVRARSQPASRLLSDPDPRVVSLAKGIIRHHHDDRIFHQIESFVLLSSHFSVELREHTKAIEGSQPGFVGHIAVELLLDSHLIEHRRDSLDQYYRILEDLDGGLIQQVVNRISRVPTDRVESLLPRFAKERFLYDYLEDDRLHWRLNHVMHRIGLPALPVSVIGWLGTARSRVREAADSLLVSLDTEPDWNSLNVN